MTPRVHLIVHSTDASECARLRSLFRTSADVTIFEGTGPAAAREFTLDAVLVPGMHMTYWGLSPFLANRAEVFPTPSEKRTQGMPAHFVAAWLLPEDGRSEGGSYAELLLGAVDKYNASNSSQPIERVGSLSDFLALRGAGEASNAEALRKILADRASLSSPKKMGTHVYA